MCISNIGIIELEDMRFWAYHGCLETERTEGVDAGVSLLVGADYDKIIEESTAILSKSKDQTRFDVKKNPYGDGHSSEKIEKLISNFFS